MGVMEGRNKAGIQEKYSEFLRQMFWSGRQSHRCPALRRHVCPRTYGQLESLACHSGLRHYSYVIPMSF